MPKRLHEALEREAKKRGLTGERRKAFIFGTLNKVSGKKKRGKAKR